MDDDDLLRQVKEESFKDEDLLEEMRSQRVPDNVKRSMEEMERNTSGEDASSSTAASSSRYRVLNPTRVVSEMPKEDRRVEAEWLKCKLPKFMDDDQERDWPRRGAIDADLNKDSCLRLWRMPVHYASQGAKKCFPCECGLRKCRGISAGQTVHDCVCCWSCRRSFHAPDVDGFQEHVLGPTSDKKAIGQDTAYGLLLGWGRCPRCAAQLGASSMPTIFAGRVHLLAEGSTPNPFDTSAVSNVPDAYLAEVEYCLDADIGPPTVERCTRAVNALNKLRSMCLKPFYKRFGPLVRARLLLAHLQRAKVEGNADLAQDIGLYLLSLDDDNDQDDQDDSFQDEEEDDAIRVQDLDMDGLEDKDIDQIKAALKNRKDKKAAGKKTKKMDTRIIPPDDDLRKMRIKAFQKAEAPFAPGVGTGVIAEGLTSKRGKPFNGAIGIVDATYEDIGRASVRFPGEEKPIAIKFENLRLVPS